MAAALAIPLGATAVFGAATRRRLLLIEEVGSGERLRAVPVDEGTTVVLEYVHSVEKTPIRDVYVVEGSALRMERTEFSSFGAGLPTEGVESTDDGFVHYRDHRYEELAVAPATIAGHELVVDGERIDLVALAEGSVVLSIGEESFAGRVRRAVRARGEP